MRNTDRARPGDRQPLTFTIPQAAQLLGISVSKAYEAARSGQLPTLRVGSRVLISRRRLEELVDGRMAARDHAFADEDIESAEWEQAQRAGNNWWNRNR
jgi:excisionase family DNA binding protein